MCAEKNVLLKILLSEKTPTDHICLLRPVLFLPDFFADGIAKEKVNFYLLYILLFLKRFLAAYLYMHGIFVCVRG